MAYWTSNPFLTQTNKHGNIYYQRTILFCTNMETIYYWKHYNAESLGVKMDIFVICKCKNGHTAMFYMENNITKDR